MAALLVFVLFLKTKKVVFGFVTLGTSIFSILKRQQKATDFNIIKTEGIGNEKIFDGDKYIYYSHIVEDNKGNIWLTTWSQGVYKYDGKDITNYLVKRRLKECEFSFNV
jgi:hypothetical protein